MKSIKTIFFILFIASFAQAQEKNTEVKITIQTEVVVLNKEVVTSTLNTGEDKIARIYLYKKKKLIKDLLFITKEAKSKLV
ncbi:hypothetical protein H0I23_02680 [Cellulophaga sp. HaHaR_3_176]|uniref:hypothetical protein n=1 Tax=Cellulophaga sp. HaHaR_3_176 TaxID=1942464 RepID=UPI001C1FE6F4|nr:hypothetical protein [Cellulophaga sp. HaHaR_3_176]QWX84569.1 hypothetical protein H0I23_02680 [Cellulophaga sp. HaHaR_3_176]